jgi:hypothetical protein
MKSLLHRERENGPLFTTYDVTYTHTQARKNLAESQGASQQETTERWWGGREADLSDGEEKIFPETSAFAAAIGIGGGGFIAHAQDMKPIASHAHTRPQQLQRVPGAPVP